MQELINMLKQFDNLPAVVKCMKSGDKANALTLSVTDLDAAAEGLLGEIMDQFDKRLITADGKWNHVHWKELKQLAAAQGFAMSVEHGGEDGDSAGIETPHAIFWIDCEY